MTRCLANRYLHGVSQWFSTEVARVDGATVIYVRGEIDIATCERLRDTIEPHMGPQQTIVLDLSGVQFMGTAGLHVLEQARGTLTADGGSLILRNPSEAARLLLTAARAEWLLEGGNDRPAEG
jgi:anti-anti-sigma factor